MIRHAMTTMLAAGLVLAAGCGPKTSAPTVHASMTQVIAPQAQAIWDVTNAAYNDAGDGLDPAKISAADWTRLGQAGRQVSDQARQLAQARKVVAAAPGVKIDSEGDAGAAGAKEVQAYIDANPAAFAERARKLADAGDMVVKAAQAKDVKPLFAASTDLDPVCESCHVQFWYPKQARPKP